MDSFCGIAVSDNQMCVQEVWASKSGVDVKAGQEDQVDSDIWQMLEPGAFDPNENTSDLKSSLYNMSRSHQWYSVTEDFLHQRTTVPSGIGLAVPYASSPMVRTAMCEALRDVLGERDRRRSTIDSFIVAGVETPIALAIERHAHGERGLIGVVSRGTKSIEVTGIRMTSDSISVERFRETIPKSVVTACQEFLDGSEPVRQWFVAPTAIDFVQGIQRHSSVEAVSWDVIASGAARFAQFGRPSINTPFPQIRRISPRAMGIVGRNHGGELFWHRLIDSSEAAVESGWDFGGFRGMPGTIPVAAWESGSCDYRWLVQSKWNGRLQWWQEPLSVAPGAASESEPVRVLCVEDDEGFHLSICVNTR